MKVLLLAFDGLEYNLVVKLRLNYVKEVDEILTPNVWASFLTGALPQIHKAYTFSIVRWRRLNSNSTFKQSNDCSKYY